MRIFAEQNRADLILFQVHGDARHTVRELDQLAGHHLLESVDAGDAIAHGNYRAGLTDVDGPVVIFNFLPQQGSNLVCSNLSHNCESPNLLLCCQFTPQSVQLATHGTVIDGGTDARDHPPDQLRLHRIARPNFLSGEP